MCFSFIPEGEKSRPAGRVKLRSIFAVMAVVGLFLAWHRHFAHLYENNKAAGLVTTSAMGLPLAIFLAGVWPKWREPLFAAGPVIILLLCVSCTWSTVDILAHIPRSVSCPSEYSVHSREMLWGTFLWGFVLPAVAFFIAAAFEIERSELKRHGFAFSACVLSLTSALAANLFAVWLFTARIRDLAQMGAWLRHTLGIAE